MNKRIGDRQCFMMIFCISLIMGMVTGIFVDWQYFGRMNTVCNTDTCKRAASALWASMDTSVLPCHNFYKFACGKYSTTYPLQPYEYRKSWTRDLVNYIENLVYIYLNQPDTFNDPSTIRSIRALYRSCMDVDALDDRKYEYFVGSLSFINLPILPVFQKDATIDWVAILAGMIKTGFLQFVISTSVYRDPNNLLMNTIHIKKANTQLFRGYNWDSNENNFEWFKYSNNVVSLTGNDVNAAKNGEEGEPKKGEEEIEVNPKNKDVLYKFVLGAMRLIKDHYHMDSINLDDPQVIEDLNQLYNFVYKRDTISRGLYLDEKHFVQRKMTIKSLQKKTDKLTGGKSVLNWIKYLNTVFAGVFETPHDFNEDDMVVVCNWQYMQRMIKLLAKTDSRIIAMAMWYDSLILFAPVSTKELKELHDTFKKEIGMLPSDPIDRECTRAMISKFAMGVSHLFTKDPYAYFKKYKVEVMTDLIKEVFKTTLRKANWINPNTKNAALYKMDKMRKYVAFPLWLNDPYELAQFYDGTFVYDNYVANTLRYFWTTANNNLKRLFVYNNKDDPGWSMYPTTVNACYNPNTNALTIPYAAMNLPYYDYGVEALNYGSMAVVIAHEITHGFDNNGKNYDESGNSNPWMTIDTTKKFREGARCFIKSYGDLVVPELNKKVDGELTLNENIADNGGIALAFEAYRMYKRCYGDLFLPGFENYTHEQLFTISYAMIQCGAYSAGYLESHLRDEHTPPEQRINGIVMNFSEFPKIWGCKKDDPMNPKDKCKIW